jgi:hypothetical protein
MDKKAAINLIEDTFNAHFSEEQFTLFARNLLNDLEPKNNAYSGNYIWDDYKEHINTYKRIGKYIDPEGEALDVLIVEVKSVLKLERARTALRNFVIKHLSKFEKDYALVAFYSKEDEGADWRFSFIKLEYRSELDEAKGKVKTKKEFTPAKRYSFLVGEYEKAHTAKNQLLPLLQNIANNPTVTELESAFSIEKVTDEFFNQYKDLYVKLFEHFENDTHIKSELAKANIDNARFTKKLLGQIVFLYFLQKKGWLGVPKDQVWGKGQKRFIQNLFDQTESEEVNFFKDKLQFLFYEALAKERNNDNSFYKKFNCRIPFLNGGLFEAEYDWQNANISIPTTLFRNEEKNKAGDIGTGALDVFDRYNFTIKEDEPLDKEVAVDPEMLGKVFENMLEITERKSKGAFYTPREVVHYMCQESLIHYLDNALNDATASYQAIDSDQTNIFGSSSNKKGQAKIELEHKGKIIVPKTDIETYIREGHFALENDQRVANTGKETSSYKYQLPESIRQYAELINTKLTEIRICDPAIGSGAFPVGLLHELVNAMLVLKPHFREKYIKEKLVKLGFETAKQEINESRYIYRLKRHIIQESIYGVDIDASAIDIARLRLWLSLVVDEDDLDPIETLPNLDYKIVCGNSLIGMPETAMRNLGVEKELEALKEQFYNQTNETKKKALRLQINTKIRELLDSAEQFAGYKIDFDFKLFFSEVWREKDGFDVVIGNPPYVVDSKMEKWQKEYFIRNYKSALYQINLYMLFMETAFKLSKKRGFCSYIVPNTWLINKVVGPFRKYLVETYNILSIVDLTEVEVFDATVLPIIFTSLNTIPEKELKIIDGYNYTFNYKAHLTIENIVNQPNFLINYQITDIDWKVLAKIERETLPLGKIAKSSFGVKFYQKGKGKPKQDEFIVKNHAFTHDSPIDSTCLNVLEGKNVERFTFKPGKNYIQYGEWLAEPRDKEMFIGERVLLRRIVSSNGLISAFVDGNYCNNSLLHVVKPIDLSAKTIACILNSDLIGYYFIKKFARKEKTFPEIRIHEINSLPIRLGFEESYFKIIHDYISHSITLNQDLISSFYISLNSSIIFELYFPEELKSADKEILKHLGVLKPITEEMSEEEKLAIIQSEFERLYDPNHPVRNAIETLDSIEEVRIIKEALK